jgi:outer membrane immunogenic protein
MALDCSDQFGVPIMKYTVCLLSAIAAVALGSSTAFGADLARPAYMPPPPPPPVASWSGFYFGINGGLGGGQYQYPATVGPLAGTAKLNSSGFFGGGQAGFNWQVAPAWVVGLEADFDGADIEGNANAATGFAAASAGTKLDWFGTVRGRAGVLVTPNALLYATGGWAYGRTTSSANATLTGIASASVSVNNNQSGWTVGGGLEYALNSWLTFKTEYLYMDLGTANLVSGTVAGVGFTLNEKTTVQTAKVGLNVKLGGWGSGWAP